MSPSYYVFTQMIDITQERDGWADSIYLLEKNIQQGSAQEITMEVGIHWRIERKKERKKKWMEDCLKGRVMRTVVKDEKSEWREVKSGVSQGSWHQ